MGDPYYKALEDRFRGSRELIRERLRAYLPFVEVLQGLHDPCSALDLGCGRGEWLELLAEQGVPARGVDLDDGMVGECRQRGLEARQGDAVALLRRCSDESESLVSAIHVAEHLPVDELRGLLAEAVRVLRPAGLMVLETPNPENLLVASCGFHLDPDHRRPLPPMLLEFLAEQAGFVRTKVVRLHELSPQDEEEPGLDSVLNGVSRDFALVAQKEAPPELLARFEPLFEKQYGVTIEAALARYEAGLGRRIERAVAQRLRAGPVVQELVEQERSARQRAEAAAEAERDARVELERALASEREARIRLRSDLRGERQSRRALQARFARESKARAKAKSRLKEVYRSRSWRLTWPLRKVGAVVRGVVRRPRPAAPREPGATELDRSQAPSRPPPASPDHLTPEARRIFVALQQAISSRRS